MKDENKTFREGFWEAHGSAKHRCIEMTKGIKKVRKQTLSD